MLCPITTITIIFIISLLAIAFYTLLERKVLGYIHLRKGPNKSSVIGITQPLADALKLFLKEQSYPKIANTLGFLFSPLIRLLLSLIIWFLYPYINPSFLIPISIILFLCISSLNVYTTIWSGWFSNSKYALLGALRRVAQTISYEVRITLILLRILISSLTLTLSSLILQKSWPLLISPILFIIWFTTILAETNRTPFDFAEGESELVSGFNTEYRRGTFALIFIAEYSRIIIIRILTAIIFSGHLPNYFLYNFILVLKAIIVAIIFLWIRGTLPRIRYDKLIYLTWKTFLLFALISLTIFIPLSIIII